jgi:hypothetical protein
MITMLKPWQGRIAVNGQEYSTVDEAISNFKPGKGSICIKLYQKQERGQNEERSELPSINKPEPEVRITVKKYMTEKATKLFDFMAKWNNDVPMPLRTMTGRVLKETKGMVQMELHGDIWAEKICTCMACGRQLTNPVSQYFGIGPECGGHNYTNPFNSQEELKEAVQEYKRKLQATTWTGWIIKSAIIKEEEV